MQDNSQIHTIQNPQPVTQPVTTPITPPPPTSSELPARAGFVLRGGAYIIDTFIVGIPIVILATLFPGMDEESTQGLLGLLLLVYFSLATGIYGTTLGKKFYKLRVIRTDGSKVGIGRAFLREFIGKILSSLIFSLGFFWVIWDKEKQAWHDKIARTYVVITQPLSKGKVRLAYFLAFLLPGLAILGIIAAIVLVAINPLGKIEEARKAAEELERKQVETDIKDDSNFEQFGPGKIPPVY